MSHNRSSTTRLPSSLREQIEAQNGDLPGRNARSRKPNVNRKEARRLERQNVKQRKAQFHSARTVDLKRPAIEPQTGVEAPQRKKQRIAEANPTPKTDTEPLKATKTSSKAKSTALQKLTPRKDVSVTPLAFNSRSMREREEDAYIASLESKLGVNRVTKGKSRYDSAFADDGLLDILVELDSRDDHGHNEFLEKGLSSEEDDEQTEETQSNDDQCLQEEWTGFQIEAQELVQNEHDPIRSTTKSLSHTTPDSMGRVGSRYIPPHLRKQHLSNAAESETNSQLSRQLKGLLNRMSEQNVATILKDIEGLYQSHRRHDITATLTNLIIDGTSSHSSLLDSYVALHAGLVACLHKIVGVEFAAYFVQNLVISYERHYARTTTVAILDVPNPPDLVAHGKECSNLLVLLTELYNFQVVSCLLMYDIIRVILNDDLTEIDVELLLKIARNSGPQLRQDDPSALKDIIQIVQNKISSQEGELSSRTRFMIETLTNIKNNKIKRQTAQGTGDANDRIRKFVAGIGKTHHVLAHEPLRVSLEDLHLADSKGKWWLVGAAWGGDPLVDRQSTLRGPQTNADNEAHNTLMKLARKQGMNTDVRRSIFVVLLSSDDYVDACDRLSQLNLTETQQREIIRVLLHCCGNEKTYNPYYTLIGQHLCRLSHSHKVTLQFCLWDFLRCLGEKGIGGAEMMENAREDDVQLLRSDIERVSTTRIMNVAKAYAWWIATGSVTLTILKPLDFVSLQSQTRSFLKQMFTHLFVNTQDPSLAPSSNLHDAVAKRDRGTLEEVMIKAIRLPALTKGIVFLISSIFRGVDNESDDLSKLLSWACEVSKDVLRPGL